MRALTKRERFGALMVGALELKEHILEHRYQGVFGGTTTMIGALELVTISKLLFYLCSCLFIHNIHSMFMFYDLMCFMW